MSGTVSTWTPEKADEAFRLAAQHGTARGSRRKIAATLGVTYAQLDGFINRNIAEWRRAQQGQRDEGAAVREWAARRDAAQREVERAAERDAAFLDRFRPVDLPPLPRTKAAAKPGAWAVVSSDHHWPIHDPRVESIILQVIDALRPAAYVLNGDGPDMLALSNYPKDARRGKSWELRDEQRAAKSWWYEVGRRMQQWGGACYETEANHSGNGRESRWRRWLNEHAAPLFGLDGFEADCSYGRYFHHPDVPVSLVDEHVIAGELRVRHGEIVRKHGGYSARAHGDKWQTSVMHGHTHRIGSSVKRRPGIPGVRADEWIRTYETGCACRLDADYCPGADWAQGFAVVQLDPASPNYGVELVHVVEGVATVNALGATLRARAEHDAAA